MFLIFSWLDCNYAKISDFACLTKLFSVHQSSDLVLGDEFCSFSRESSLHVERDGSWKVSLSLLHLPGPLLLPAVQEVLVVGGFQSGQVWMTLGED